VFHYIWKLHELIDLSDNGMKRLRKAFRDYLTQFRDEGVPKDEAAANLLAQDQAKNITTVILRPPPYSCHFLPPKPKVSALTRAHLFLT
jgi:hypothetical protein